MNGNLIKACECVSAQKKMSLLLKSHLDKGKSNRKEQNECALVQECDTKRNVRLLRCLQRVEKGLCCSHFMKPNTCEVQRKMECGAYFC